VPTRNQFDRNTTASAPDVASKHLRDSGKESMLSERAQARRRELKHRRYTQRMYRG
jgi:hypothetical protein